MANQLRSESDTPCAHKVPSSDCPYRHVALVEIQGKEFQLKPIPLRTVRPFVLEDLILSETAEEEGFDINDQIAVSKFLKSRVNQFYFDQRQLC